MPYTDSRNKDLGVTNPSRSPDQMTLQNQIVFADATVHVATDKGVFSSKDGVVCGAITAKALFELHIEQMLNEPDLRVHALQERANILTLAPEIWKAYDSEGHSFFNINTPEDFEKAQTALRFTGTAILFRWYCHRSTTSHSSGHHLYRL